MAVMGLVLVFLGILYFSLLTTFVVLRDRVDVLEENQAKFVERIEEVVGLLGDYKSVLEEHREHIAMLEKVSVFDPEEVEPEYETAAVSRANMAAIRIPQAFRICPSCGSAVPASEINCPQCGAQIVSR